MFTITDQRTTPASHQTDRDGADAAYLRFVDEGFVRDPERCTFSDMVLVRGGEHVTIAYTG
jgi:hypothetical protein